MRRRSVLAVLLAWSFGAAAEDLPEARALYRAGEMDEAAAIARSLGSAVAYALAAKATLVQALEASDSEREALLERAAKDAGKALELDPRNVEARLQLAAVLGRLAQGEDPLTAHMRGYAQDGKQLLDQALALAPQDAQANALLGMWHLQVVRYAGEGLAESLYGATEETGLDYCAKATALAPQDLSVRFGCALSRVQVDPERFRRSALQDLAQVARLPPRDAADRLIQNKAEHVLDKLKSGSLE